MYLILDYCLGSLQDLLEVSPNKKFPLWQAHGYTVQLVDGLSYLHSQGIVHKDIKPGNLLITLDEMLKITDFGVAEALGTFSPEDTCHTSQGSPVFQPPEVANGESFAGYKLDVWSSGVTLYNLTTGKYPFEGDTIFLLFENIANGEFSIPSSLDPLLTNLLYGMLHKNPVERFSVSQIMHHPWIQKKPYVVMSDKVSVPPERRKISVLPYIEEYLRGSDEDLSDEYGDVYQTCKQADLQYLRIEDNGKEKVCSSAYDIMSYSSAQQEPLHIMFTKSSNVISADGYGCTSGQRTYRVTPVFSALSNGTSFSNNISPNNENTPQLFIQPSNSHCPTVTVREPAWRRSLHCVRKLPICRQT